MRERARATGAGRRALAAAGVAAVVVVVAAGSMWLAARGRRPGPPTVGPVLARLSVEPDTARIGEPVRVVYEVRAPAGVVVAFAARPADDSLWTWREWKAGTARAAPDGVHHRLRAVGLPFRVGALEVPAARYRVRRAEGAGAAGSFPRTLVVVASVLPPGEARPDVRGLKPPFPSPWWTAVPWWALGALGVLALALWWWLRRRPGRASARAPAAAAVSTPADVEALSALEALTAARLPERGLWYEHQSRLTGIVRRFLERRFGSPQPGYTTRELCLHLAWRGLTGGDVERLRTLLRVADLAKFARTDPGLEVARQHEGKARALVLAWAEAEPSAAGEGAGGVCVEAAPGSDTAAGAAARRRARAG